MKLRLGLLAAVALLLAGCSDEPSTTRVKAMPSTATPTPSAYPFTNCDALEAGDALTTTEVVCRAGDDGEGQLGMTDCLNGTYMRLDRERGQDLEGIVAPTSVWRDAAPIDSAVGRTPWAFANCRESG